MEAHDEAPKHKRRKISVKVAPEVNPMDEEDGEDGEDEIKPLTLPALLASFPHGLPRDPCGLEFSGSTSDTRRGRKVPRARLAARTSHVTYKCDQPLTTRAAPSKYLVGVFNKGTGELTLHPVDTILALNQSIAGQEEEEEEERKGADPITAAERRKSLIADFGTKKKKRVMQSREDNRISAESVVGMGALGSFLTDAAKAAAKADAENAENGQDVVPPEDSAADASRAQLLPLYDKRATSGLRAYPPRHVMTPEAWASLEGVVDEALGAMDVAEEPKEFRAALLQACASWPDFVRAAVGVALVPEPGGEDRGRRGAPTPKRDVAVCLLFLRHLFKLQGSPQVHRGDVESLAQSLECPEAVAFSMVERSRSFMQKEGNRYVRTKALNDKLMLHIMVLCLVVSNFRLHISTVAKDLRMSQGDCATLFRETGASTKRANKTDSGPADIIVELNCPLKFPNVKRYRRR